MPKNSLEENFNSAEFAGMIEDTMVAWEINVEKKLETMQRLKDYAASVAREEMKALLPREKRHKPEHTGTQAALILGWNSCLYEINKRLEK